jgi:enoyl-CoA hydratase
MHELVRVEHHGPVALLRMDDGKANALSHPLIDAVNAAVDRASEGDARALVLSGRPGRFSGGFDLKAMMASPAAARDLVRAGGELMMRLYEHPLPLVIACTGHAVAGGVLLAATGDLRIGARGPFKLGLNEVSNGMPVPILAHELARDRLDPRHLVEAVLFARLYDPEAALQVGWLDRLAEPDQLEAEAISAAQLLAALPAPAYAHTKRSLRRATIEHIRATVEQNLAQFTITAG